MICEVGILRHTFLGPVHTIRRKNLKTQQSPVILDLYLRKTRSGKSHDYRDVIAFEKLCFRLQENAKPAVSNSSGLKSIFEMPRTFS